MEPTATSSDPTAPKNYALDGKIMLFSVVGFLAAVFFVFFAQSCFRRRRRRRSYLHGYSGAGTTAHGLDPSVLKSLPTFAYSAAAHEPLLECAVCLSRFQNDEPGRVLPRCGHTFHVDCIDMWLRSHSNCPLCRVPVQVGVVTVREPGRVKEEAAGCSSPAPEPSFDLLMGVSSLV